ncbi:MAG: hypothetical protein WC242_03775 [Candidatus Paceibacterota bacterium]|jgi:hypothetical protein
MKKKIIDVHHKGIAYVILDEGICVFTATGRESLSTINCAEDIVRAIARKENKPIKAFRFFDLQTHTGYESKRPGEVEYDQLLLEMIDDELLSVQEWLPEECPAKVREIFREYIE